MKITGLRGLHMGGETARIRSDREIQHSLMIHATARGNVADCANLVSTDTTGTDVIPVKVVQRSRWSEDKLEFGANYVRVPGW